MSKLDGKFMQRLSQSRIFITNPIGYLDFLHLQTKARLVLTDSGGVQVETKLSRNYLFDPPILHGMANYSP